MSTDDTLKDLAETVCLAWNRLDPAILEPVLAEDFVYSSFWKISDLEGKENYLEYIDAKMRNIRRNLSSGNSGVTACVLFQKEIGKNVVVLTQRHKDFALEITAEGGLISKMWLRPVNFLPIGGAFMASS